MPKLVIDDREIEVPAGTKVIEAAEQLGIMIPRFCYHKALGPVGACRMCAVKFLQGPIKGLQMSCTVDAQDGMVVATTDEEAMAFRKYIIELLMLNHPHDCPVCDEGGQCLLQDMTVSGGHGIRRYLGRKRTYRDQNLGVFIAHEMNRCIHCYRCSRFYQEFAGYHDLGPVQIANRVYFGRFQNGQLESPFSGSLVDLCPTGVYTDKPARYKGRRWDFERAPSLCIHCSLGCNTIGNARYRAMVRIEARFNEKVNGYFICDRGRFGFAYANHPERPRRARVDGIEVSLEQAAQAASQRLMDIVQNAGSDGIACLGSLRSSLETQTVLKHLCRSLDWHEPDYFLDLRLKRKVRSAVAQLDKRVGVSLRELEAADFILAVGVDPIGEAPMLALAMRQAFRKEGTVVVIDPRPVSLPFKFEHLAVPTQDIERCLKLLLEIPPDPPLTKGGDSGDLSPSPLMGEVGWGCHGSQVSTLPQPLPEGEGSLLAADSPELPKGDQEELPPSGEGDRGELSENHVGNSWDTGLQQQVTRLAVKLKVSRNPVLICGTDVVPESTPSVVGGFVRSLLRENEKCGLCIVLPGANAFGAALLDAAGDHAFENTLEAIEQGVVKALIVVEADPFWCYPDRRRLEQALEGLELLVVLDYLPSPVAERAHVFLPTLTHFETGSSFINQEGRLQRAESVYRGGTPVSQVGRGGHPPRLYSADLPGGEAKAAWQLLADLSRLLSDREALPPGFDPLSLAPNEHASFAVLRKVDGPPDGIRYLPDVAEAAPLPREIEEDADYRSKPLPNGVLSTPLQLLLVDSLFGTEELSRYADVIQKVEGEPSLLMHIDDAARLGFADGDRVSIPLENGSLEVRMRLSRSMAQGTLILPRHRMLDWQRLKGFSVTISGDGIKEIAG
jgi:NADH-quinone oxidoreductase subunit G